MINPDGYKIGNIYKTPNGCLVKLIKKYYPRLTGWKRWSDVIWFGEWEYIDPENNDGRGVGSRNWSRLDELREIES